MKFGYTGVTRGALGLIVELEQKFKVFWNGGV